MRSEQNRRSFIKTSALAAAGIGLGINGFAENLGLASKQLFAEGTRVGIIGLDTSHCVAFTKALNNPTAGLEFGGFKVLAAYPYGSRTIQSSFDRISGYTAELKTLGVEITGSIADLMKKVDFILL